MASCSSNPSGQQPYFPVAGSISSGKLLKFVPQSVRQRVFGAFRGLPVKMHGVGAGSGEEKSGGTWATGPDRRNITTKAAMRITAPNNTNKLLRFIISASTQHRSTLCMRKESGTCRTKTAILLIPDFRLGHYRRVATLLASGREQVIIPTFQRGLHVAKETCAGVLGRSGQAKRFRQGWSLTSLSRSLRYQTPRSGNL
jgi:hypothetical protein